MNKKLKKLCTIALTFAITATSAMSMSLSADCLALPSIFTDFSDFTIIDDKGMMGEEHEKYKMIYDDQYKDLVKAEANFRIAKFILSEDVDYEEANERIIEIFKEFYPDNYLDVSPDGIDYLEYSKNYKPNLKSYTVDGVTIYTFYAIDRQMPGIEEEKIAEARKYSKDFMKKLNNEKLISAFYDFGEVYYTGGTYVVDIGYSLDADIDLVYNYINENNIDCTVKKDDYRYKLEFNDDSSYIERFLIAADIYEETSIAVDEWFVLESENYGNLYGKNALEDLTKAGNANEDETVDIRDAAFIARKVAQRKVEELPEWADYNNDNKLDILDAATIARDVARRILK